VTVGAPVASRDPPAAVRLEDLELSLLLEAVFQHSGHDFREYAAASIKRRVLACVEKEDAHTISGLQARVLHEPACLARLLAALSINVTSMFRDPPFYLAFRKHVVPVLRTYPFIRLWHAGCATGEEAYSMAILLQEEGLYDRCRVYATDINATVLEKAKAGVFPLAAMKDYTTHYMHAGGTRSFSEYYSAGRDGAEFQAGLRANTLFSQHNLATDGPFNEFQVILCRNTLIYFNRRLTDRVCQLFNQSLVPLGFLGLGAKETLHGCTEELCFEEVDDRNRLYRKTSKHCAECHDGSKRCRRAGA
jgi:chemotaxis protein methyltransferase CheR